MTLATFRTDSDFELWRVWSDFGMITQDTNVMAHFSHRCSPGGGVGAGPEGDGGRRGNGCECVNGECA